MEKNCTNSYCKKMLKEYRESNSKLYDDIYSLEDDLKDKDTFAQNVTRQRNQSQEEVSVLKKKNTELTKENDDLIEKVNQLDEDTDAGVEMLQMAHERERKTKVELKELKDKVEKMKELEKENDLLKTKFKFVKDKLETCLKQNHEAVNLKAVKIKELEDRLLSSIHIDVSNKNEEKIKEQALEIEKLQNENILTEKKNTN